MILWYGWVRGREKYKRDKHKYGEWNRTLRAIKRKEKVPGSECGKLG